ncbi:hypothetical protein VTN77DRAFT_5162 [Rasamsonia byssochlamydoides]|uniref:uncharacterized protein n=1 Tax=Rasamsonia byssochlamydoides TaxID=89139 RepID=UPI00374221D3
MPLFRLGNAVWNRSFLYSLTVVALLSAKLLHVFSHLASTSIPLFVLYFPTFLTPDVFVILTSRLIFQRSLICSVLLCLIITLGASAQISLFVETGGELRWSMLGKISREPQGFVGMLLTGLMSTSITTCVLACVAYFLTPSLYNIAYQILNSLFTTIFPRTSRSRGSYNLLSPEDGEEEGTEKTEAQRGASIIWARVKLIVLVSVLLILHIVRPHSPFDHMTTTLPFTMLDAIFHPRSPLCDPSPFDGSHAFPFPDLISQDLWVAPTVTEGGNWRGWKPGSPWWEVRREMPSWLPRDKPVSGFDKWYRGSSFQLPANNDQAGGEKSVQPTPTPGVGRGEHSPVPPSGYESVLDPLKITNVDQPLLDALQDALQKQKSAVDIRHVIILTLESTRKDVFPLIKGGRLYQELEQSWKSHKNKNHKRDHKHKKKPGESKSRADFSQLSINAEAVTGEEAGFGREVNKTHGGVNVLGALTASTSTVKSMLASHCGVNPLPVDFLEEVETEIYQPCLPQILKVMNSNKKKQQSTGATATSWKQAPWRSVFMQAGTGLLDRQTQLMNMIGFDLTIDREYLKSPNAEFRVAGKEVNYLGYSEKELRPYLRKAITDAEDKGERLLLSHITTTTHHPWTTPGDADEQEDYWGDSRANSPFNRYLNTVKYADRWVGEVLDLINDLGVADKTLVVVLGDHGFAFGGTKSSMKTTYANPHISSFPVPLTFHHPQLPRATVNATVTPLSLVPTILDLLASTGSLDATDLQIARDLIPEYEGQSLIRRFVPTRPGHAGHGEREAWSFSVVNPGGTHLAVVSAAHPYRYVLPICELSPYSFSDLATDPVEETAVVQDWEGGAKMVEKVRKAHGAEAARWAARAEKIAKWYVWEARNRWGYWSGARQDDRGVEHREDGVFKHDHWWDT